MGQTLSSPIVDKNTASGEDDRLEWAVSEMQGWRLSMEDAHAHILSLGESTPSTSTAFMTDGESGETSTEGSSSSSSLGSEKKTSFFAVYDGHGGSTVARFAGDTVHSRLAALDSFKSKDFEKSLKRAFLATDEDLRANPDFRGDPSGCTAVATIIDEDMRIICANAGDSRSVLSVGGLAKPMSYDHKPTNKGENARILAGGGFVEFGRVNGNLALSRALGDFEFKQSPELDAENQIVTANPDIIVHHHTEEDEFLILACDGIWDVLTSQQVIDYVRRSIYLRKELSEICESLMDKCLAPDSDWGGVGCDNMTVMIIALKGKRTKVEWYNWVGERVERGDEGKEGAFKTPLETIDPFAAGPRGVTSGGAADDGEEEEEEEGEEEEEHGEEHGEEEVKAVAEGTEVKDQEQ